MEKFKLGLNLPTDPRWVNIAEKNIADILTDHAYCEQKAASSCISMIIKFSDKQGLVDMMTPVVAEEWSHFERVLEKMKERGFSLGRPRNDAYVKELSKAIKKGGNQNDQLMESLLVNALIDTTLITTGSWAIRWMLKEGMELVACIGIDANYVELITEARRHILSVDF